MWLASFIPHGFWMVKLTRHLKCMCSLMELSCSIWWITRCTPLYFSSFRQFFANWTCKVFNFDAIVLVERCAASISFSWLDWTVRPNAILFGDKTFQWHKSIKMLWNKMKIKVRTAIDRKWEDKRRIRVHGKRNTESRLEAKKKIDSIEIGAIPPKCAFHFCFSFCLTFAHNFLSAFVVVVIIIASIVVVGLFVIVITVALYADLRRCRRNAFAFSLLKTCD